jgi:hypothetical protein
MQRRAQISLRVAMRLREHRDGYAVEREIECAHNPPRCSKLRLLQIPAARTFIAHGCAAEAPLRVPEFLYRQRGIAESAQIREHESNANDAAKMESCRMSRFQDGQTKKVAQGNIGADRFIQAKGGYRTGLETSPKLLHCAVPKLLGGKSEATAAPLPPKVSRGESLGDASAGCVECQHRLVEQAIHVELDGLMLPARPPIDRRYCNRRPA